MPLGLDPQATFELSLDTDKEKPQATRPAFVFRFLTSRQFLKVQQLRAAAREEKDNAACLAKMDEALLIGLAGWKNMGDVAFSADAINDVLTIDERWELLESYLAEQRTSEVSKKASRLLSSGGGVGSVTDATAASAPSNTPSPNPSSSDPSASNAGATPPSD